VSLHDAGPICCRKFEADSKSLSTLSAAEPVKVNHIPAGLRAPTRPSRVSRPIPLPPSLVVVDHLGHIKHKSEISAD
jgi:hypothetical protein